MFISLYLRSHWLRLIGNFVRLNDALTVETDWETGASESSFCGSDVDAGWFPVATLWIVVERLRLWASIRITCYILFRQRLFCSDNVLYFVPTTWYILFFILFLYISFYKISVLLPFKLSRFKLVLHINLISCSNTLDCSWKTASLSFD
jgi:hypothetical protein